MESIFTSAPNPRGHVKYDLKPRSDRQSHITVPKQGHPIAKLIFAEMKKQNKSYSALEWESGVLVTTAKAWRTHSRPGLETAEAALGALGWSLVPVPRMERLPKKLQAELERLSSEWATDEPLLNLLLAEMCKAPFIARSGRMEHYVRLRQPIGGILAVKVEPSKGATFGDIAKSTGLAIWQAARLSHGDRTEILRLMSRNRVPVQEQTA